jgi:magnesium transporter
MRRISAWVAIWAIPTLLAGIYGMNFKHLPELEWAFGYPLVLGRVCNGGPRQGEPTRLRR